MTEPKREIDRKKYLAGLKDIFDAIEKTILGRATDDVQHYEIETSVGKRRLDKIKLPDLLTSRDYYMAAIRRVEAEIERETQGPGARHVLVRF